MAALLCPFGNKMDTLLCPFGNKNGRVAMRVLLCPFGNKMAEGVAAILFLNGHGK